jgi:hypothetical protein
MKSVVNPFTGELQLYNSKSLLPQVVSRRQGWISGADTTGAQTAQRQMFLAGPSSDLQLVYAHAHYGGGSGDRQSEIAGANDITVKAVIMVPVRIFKCSEVDAVSGGNTNMHLTEPDGTALSVTVGTGGVACVGMTLMIPGDMGTHNVKAVTGYTGTDQLAVTGQFGTATAASTPTAGTPVGYEAVLYKPVPVTFGGSSSVVIPSLSYVISDTVPGVFASLFSPVTGREYAPLTRTYCDPGAANVVPTMEGMTQQLEGSGSGDRTDTTTAGFNAWGTTSGSTGAGMMPVCVLGIPQGWTGKPVLIMGDSLRYGVAASTPGFSKRRDPIQRALAHSSLPFMNLSTPGERGSYTKALRISIAQAVGIKAAILGYGRNDMGSFTALQMKGYQEGIIAALSPIPTYQVTLEPYSTGSWGTLGAQTAETTLTARNAYNAYIRAGLIGAAGYIEIADHYESARDSGKWKPGFTSDGIHPDEIAIAQCAMEVPIPAALLNSDI